jgi:hypothetical protein
LLMQFSAPSSPGPRGEMSMSSDVWVGLGSARIVLVIIEQ